MVRINLRDYYGQVCIGIQFTPHHLLLAEVQRGIMDIGVRDYQVWELGEEGGDIRSLARQIEEFTRKGRPANREYVLGIPRERAIVKEIELPTAVEENLPQVIQYELEKYIPFSPDEVYYDYQIIGRYPEDDQLRILLVAVKKDTLDHYLEILQKAHITPLIVDISSNALINTVIFKRSLADQEYRVIIQVDHPWVEFLLLEGRSLRYSRVFKTVADELLPTLRKELEYACWLGIPEGAEQTRIKELLILGEGTEIEAISRSLAEQTEIEATIMDPNDGLRPTRPDQPNPPASLAYPVGLALRGLGKTWSKLNLLPLELRRKKSKGGLVFTFILLSLIVILGMTNLSARFIQERRLLNRLEQRISQLKKEVSVIEKRQREAEEIIKKLKFFESLEQRSPTELEVLKELTTILPEDAWLTNFSLEGNRLMIHGFASSAASLIPLLDDSPLFQNVQFASPITKGRESSERFKIKLELEIERSP